MIAIVLRDYDAAYLFDRCFSLFYDGAVDVQIWAPLTRSWCNVYDTQVTVNDCGPLVKSYSFPGKKHWFRMGYLLISPKKENKWAGFTSHSIIFHWYGDVTIIVEGLKILIDAIFAWKIIICIVQAPHLIIVMWHLNQ